MKEMTLKIDGMKCDGCASAVDSALSGVDGVRRVDVSLEAGRADVVGEDDLEPDALAAAVEDAGYTVAAGR